MFRFYYSRSPWPRVFLFLSAVAVFSLYMTWQHNRHQAERLGMLRSSVSFKDLNQKVSGQNKNAKIAVASAIRPVQSFTKEGLQIFFDKAIPTLKERLLLGLDPKIRPRAEVIVDHVIRLSRKHSVDPLWTMAVIWTESHFDHTAVSSVGAKGFMQIMPETRKYLEKRMRKLGVRPMIRRNFGVNQGSGEVVLGTQDLFNLDLGIFYLSQLGSSFKDPEHATVAYNMGPNWTRRQLREGGGGVDTENHTYLKKVRRHYFKLLRMF